MDISQKSEDQKTQRHVFDAKAFRRYSAKLLIFPFFSLALELWGIFSSRYQDPDLLWRWLRIVLPAFIFAMAAGSFLVMLYTIKSSDVFTSPGCVLYRKKRFFISQSEGINFTVYHITKVRSADGKDKDPVVIKVDIDAAYVMRDGKTIHSVKKRRKVSIPPCFTDMQIIRQTLESMETGAVKSGESITSDMAGNVFIRNQDTCQRM